MNAKVQCMSMMKRMENGSWSADYQVTMVFLIMHLQLQVYISENKIIVMGGAQFSDDVN